MKRGLFILATLAAAAALAGPAPLPGGDPIQAGLGAVTIDAARLDYDRDGEEVTCSGDVRIRGDGLELTADEVVLDRNRMVARARGRVRLAREGGLEWTGEELDYNLATHEMTTGRFASFFPPYYVWAERGRKDTGSVYTLHRAISSSCSNGLGHLHYRIAARSVEIEPGEVLRARHAVVFLGPVPLFYTPWLRRSLDENAIRVRLQPGYQSRMGGFLLSGFGYRLSDRVEAETRIDYRSERGFAGGQEVGWKTAAGEGSIFAYGARDTGIDQESNEYPDGRAPDESRYRIRLRQRLGLGGGWSAVGEANAVSDEYLLEDFFRREFRRNPDPLNYALLSRIGDNQALSLMAKWRVDDCFSTLSRLPEVRHEIFLTPLGESGFFYEGENDAVWLRREYAEFEASEDVSLLRLDTRQFVSRPMAAGILHLVPRAGTRATWYSKTRERFESETTGSVTQVLADGSVLVSNAVVRTTTIEEGDSAFRPFLELGSEVSFKAFRDWASGAEDAPVRYRHIVEPYLDLTLRPALSHWEPDDFYPLDDVDTVGAEQAVRLGIRNMIQFKRDSRIYEWFDADLYGTYYFDSQCEPDGLGDLNLQVESRPADAVFMRMEAVYDTQDREMELGMIRGQFTLGPQWRLSGEYRYRRELDGLLFGRLRYAPTESWAFDVYTRYNLEEARVEEHTYQVERVLDCMGMRFGFSHEPAYTMDNGQERDDDYGVHVELWLTALPQARWGGGQW